MLKIRRVYAALIILIMILNYLPSSVLASIYTDDNVGQMDVHMEVCTTCGHAVSDGTEACTFVYQYYGQVNGSNAHVYACAVCDHIDSGPTLCIYIGTKPCLQCGSQKNQVPINNSEEELTGD